MKPRPETCLDDLVLDQLRLSELPPEHASAAQQHLDTCDACTARYAELVAEDERFLKETFISGAAMKSRKIARKQVWKRRTPWIGTALAAGLALVIILPNIETERTKGGSFSTQAYVQRVDGSQELVPDGALLHPGDSVRLRVTLKHDGDLLLYGVDANGEQTTYRELLPVKKGEIELPEDASLVLDDLLGKEQLVVRFCKNDKCKEQSFHYEKRAP